MDIFEAQERVARLNAAIRGRPLEDRDSMGLVTHLAEEVAELRDALTFEGDQGIRDELADVLILLLALSEAEGKDLDAAFQFKMKKNEKRTWQEPDGKGVIRHENDASC